MESTSRKKGKLTLKKELCSERNAYYNKLRREQKKKRTGKRAKQPEAVDSKKKVMVTNFGPRQVRQLKEVKAKEALFRGKMMVSAALNIAAKHQENEKQNKEPTSTRRSQTLSTDVLEVKSAEWIPGAKSIGSGTFEMRYLGTFHGMRVVIKDYYMASNFPVCIECFDWLVFGRDFTVRTITMETVLFGLFFHAPAPAKFKLRKSKKIKKGKGLELVQNK